MRPTAKVLVPLLMLLFMATLTLAQNPVTFQVNMSVQIAAGNFDPAKDLVVVRGSFNGWSGNQDSLSDADNDQIYVGTVDLPDSLIGKTIEYKFVMVTSSGDMWESRPNRSFVLQQGGQTLDVVYFDDNPGGVDVEVLFYCNMEVQILGGNFDPNTDVLSVRGAWNGWSNTDVMSPDAFNPNLYTALIEMHQVQTNTNIEYKFAYDKSDGSTVWEEPTSTGGGNRSFQVTGNEPDNNNNGLLDVVLDTVYFGDISPEDIFTSAQDIVFEVDMRPAYAYLAANDSIVSFAPGGAVEKSIDSVFIAGSTPGTDPPMYWVWDYLNQPDKVLPLKMNDEGQNGDLMAGDSVFSITMTFNAGAPKTATYKYGINAHDNEAGFAKNHTENVYEPPNFRHHDIFGEQDTLYALGISDLATNIPVKYRVFQNYPNPFNPTTTIPFALVQAAHVKLEIYNLLGQKVRTLVDRKMNPGVHRIEWNGTDDQGNKVSSGVYFYKFQAGDYTKTFKMVLMK